MNGILVCVCVEELGTRKAVSEIEVQNHGYSVVRTERQERIEMN